MGAQKRTETFGKKARANQKRERRQVKEERRKLSWQQIAEARIARLAVEPEFGEEEV